MELDALFGMVSQRPATGGHAAGKRSGSQPLFCGTSYVEHRVFSIRDLKVPVF
jgi:hypothetical protein